MQDKTSNRPILSISLLSSGRKKTIWKCLNSLKPIQEKIDTELIIVDTGCDEETYQRMLEYTDHIIKFTWCNDFSKARNIGLDEARGEWFLYIDDDEWFTDVTELVDFFDSGEYKDYGIATYIQRNYLNKAGTVFRDSWVSRMIRLEKDTKFVSSIHEFLYPVKGKCKLLHSPVDHFGYVFENDQEKYNHSKRNISLLEKKIDEERDVIRWWVQLVQEYMGIGEFLKVEEICKEGLEYFKQYNTPKLNASRGTFYTALLMIEMKRKDYEKAEEIYLMSIQDKRNTGVCRARIYSLASELYYKLEKYEESVLCSNKYIELYEKLYGDEFQIMIQSSFFTNDFIEEEVRNNVYSFCIGSSLKLGDTSYLKKYFYKYGWNEKRMFIYSLTPSDIVQAMASLPFEKSFIEYAFTMLKRKGVEEKVITVIQEIEKASKDSDQYINDGFLNLCNIFSKVDSKHYYVLYMKLYAAFKQNNINLAEKLYKELFSRVINFWTLEDNVFQNAIKYNIKIEIILHNIKFENWKKGVDMFFKNARQDKISLRKEFLEKLMDPSDLRYEYFFMKEREASLRILAKEKQKAKDIHNENVEDMNIVNHTEIITDNNMDHNTECTPENPLENYDLLYVQLKDYTDRYLTFYGKFFKDSAFEGEMELLPSDCRLAAKLKKVFEEEREGNIRAMTEALQGCFGVHSALDPVLKDFAKGKKEEVKEAVENRKELLSLGEQIKAQVFVLMENGMYAQAKEVLNQLKTLLPQDPELTELEERIRRELS